MSEEKTIQISREAFAESLKKKTDERCLMVMQGAMKGSKFLLTKPSMVIGRSAESDIPFPDLSISRAHATLTLKNDKVFLRDLGSSNGTLLNRDRLAKDEEKEIASGDMIQVGEIILKYLLSGEIEEAFLSEMTKNANVDAMTECFNKGYLKQYGDKEFKKVSVLGEAWSAIFIDLDHFKKVNDTYGHAAGDYVLKEFSGIIRASLRHNDLFARYGGEEFVLLLSKTPIATANLLAERLRKMVQAHAFVYNGTRIVVTSSAGVAEFHQDMPNFDEFLKKADGALYRAKSTGRNRVCTAE